MERNRNPVQNVLNRTKKISPKMRYSGGDFTAWQTEARSKLTELLGLPLEKCDDLFNVEFTQEYDTYTEIRFTFQSEENYFVPCHLLVPHGVKLPATTVICLQGHSTGMHISLAKPIYPRDEITISGGDRDFAIGAIKRGYCALTLEQRAMGECGSGENGQPACHVSAMANLIIGRTIIGERVWDVMRAIDILGKYFPQTDMENIICLGNSGGGTTTFYAACLEERIKTAIASCAVASFDDSISAMNHCVCNFVPHIREYFDMGDLGGLAAPRNLIIVTGEKDPYFPADSARKQYEIIEKLYKIAGGKCAHIIGPEGHRFYYDDAWRAFDEL